MREWIDRAIPLAGLALIVYGLFRDTEHALPGVMWGGLTAIVLAWLIGLLPQRKK